MSLHGAGMIRTAFGEAEWRGSLTRSAMLCGMPVLTRERAFAGRPWTRADDLNGYRGAHRAAPHVLSTSDLAREKPARAHAVWAFPESRIDEALATVGLRGTAGSAGQFSMGKAKQRLGIAPARCGGVIRGC